MIDRSPTEDPQARIAAIREHELKTWPEFFAPILTGEKTFEVRKADRPFAVGDVLRLREFEPTSGYTGREVTKRVSYILRDYVDGLRDNYVCMGLASLDALASAQAAPPSPCVWVVGGYFGDLRVGHNMYFAHDRVSGWKFCPMCGHPLALPEVPHE